VRTVLGSDRWMSAVSQRISAAVSVVSATTIRSGEAEGSQAVQLLITDVHLRGQLTAGDNQLRGQSRDDAIELGVISRDSIAIPGPTRLSAGARWQRRTCAIRYCRWCPAWSTARGRHRRRPRRRRLRACRQAEAAASRPAGIPGSTYRRRHRAGRRCVGGSDAVPGPAERSAPRSRTVKLHV
jgi:hypothetical protein